jgi:hypothetical protein
MYNLSNHTVQMNAWIALTRNDPTFSHSLSDLDYVCDIIEPPVIIGDTFLRPDVVLTSPSLSHSVVIDCKSNTIDADQHNRYLELDDEEHVLVEQGVVGEVPADELAAELCFSSLSDLAASGEISDVFALVHFKHSPSSGFVVLNLDGYEFELDQLREVFPINSDPGGRLPVSYYPYDDYPEDRRQMVVSVLQSVISLAVKQGEFSVEEVVRDSHLYWEALSSQKQEDLINRCRQTIYELNEAGLDDHISVIAGTDGLEWKRISKSIQAVSDKTDYYVNRVTEALDQQTLDDYDFDT